MNWPVSPWFVSQWRSVEAKYRRSTRNSDGRKFERFKPNDCFDESETGEAVFAGPFPITASTLSALIWSIIHIPFGNCHQSMWAERLVICSDRNLLFPTPFAEKPADRNDEPSQMSGSNWPSAWIDRLTLLLSHSRNESLWIKEWNPIQPEKRASMSNAATRIKSRKLFKRNKMRFAARNSSGVVTRACRRLFLQKEAGEFEQKLAKEAKIWVETRSRVIPVAVRW